MHLVDSRRYLLTTDGLPSVTTFICVEDQLSNVPLRLSCPQWNERTQIPLRLLPPQIPLRRLPLQIPLRLLPLQIPLRLLPLQIPLRLLPLQIPLRLLPLLPHLAARRHLYCRRFSSPGTTRLCM